MGTSSRWGVNNIECLAKNYKSSYMLAHSHRKEDERFPLPQIGTECTLLYYITNNATLNVVFIVFDTNGNERYIIFNPKPFDNIW